MKLRLADQTYEVIRLPEGSPRPEGMGEDYEGFVWHAKGRIYVMALPDNPARERTIVIHEMVHALLDASGASYLLGQLTEKAGVDYEDFEEILCRMLAPALTEVVNVPCP